MPPEENNELTFSQYLEQQTPVTEIPVSTAPTETPTETPVIETPPVVTEPQPWESKFRDIESRQTEIAQVLGFMMNQMQQQQTTQQTQQPAAAQTQPEFQLDIPDEIPPELHQELEEMYLDNPLKAQAKLNKYMIEQTFRRQYEAQMQRTQVEISAKQLVQRELTTGYAELVREHGENIVEQLGPGIEGMIKANPALADFIQKSPRQGLRIAFDMARSQQVSQQKPDPNNLFAQPEVKDQYKAALKDEIIKEYLVGVQSGNQSPAMIAGQPGGTPPMAPPSSPKTLDESMKLWMSNQGRP